MAFKLLDRTYNRWQTNTEFVKIKPSRLSNDLQQPILASLNNVRYPSKLQ